VLVGAILAMEATVIWPVLYWPGVAVVYSGFFCLLWDTAKGKWGKNNWAQGIMVIGLCICIAVWTFGFVFADATLRVTTQAGMGDYADGSDIAGIKWSHQNEELRVELNNEASRGYWFRRCVIRKHSK
jgi:hypothetical protein